MNITCVFTSLQQLFVLLFLLSFVPIQPKYPIEYSSHNGSLVGPYDLDKSGTRCTIKRPYTFVGHHNTLPSVKTYTPDTSPEILREVSMHKKKKHRTIMIYIAADNDLRSFAAKNIKQMTTVGSNDRVSIVVHLDIRIPGNKKITRRYLVLKDKIIHLNAHDPKTQRMDSGNPKTLISFCQWAIESFPAQEYALILWDHGTGNLNPRRGRHRTKSNLIYNPRTKKYELDRSVNFFDCIESDEGNFRAICFDDTNRSYLTDRDLQYALETIVTRSLHGQKLAIIGFDACLMSMLEIASLVKPYADIMIGSQEVILGWGYDYKKTLAPLQDNTLNAFEFARHIIHAYHYTYERITNDYTLAAIDLALIGELEGTLDAISQVLLKCLQYQKKNSVHRAIHASRSKLMCTHFDEPSFVDLDHFLHNLNENIKLFNFNNTNLGEKLKKELKALLRKGRSLIEQAVLANTTGKNLRRAAGLSIYFPEKRIHSSYPSSLFAQDNHWIDFLTLYHHR